MRSAGEELWRGPSGSVAHPAGAVECVTPPALRAGNMSVRVAPNAQQFSAPINFTYHELPELHAARPDGRHRRDGDGRELVEPAAVHHHRQLDAERVQRVGHQRDERLGVDADELMNADSHYHSVIN